VTICRIGLLAMRKLKVAPNVLKKRTMAVKSRRVFQLWWVGWEAKNPSPYTVAITKHYTGLVTSTDLKSIAFRPDTWSPIFERKVLQARRQNPACCLLPDAWLSLFVLLVIHENCGSMLLRNVSEILLHCGTVRSYGHYNLIKLGKSPLA
jgi:hypothetical protein